MRHSCATRRFSKFGSWTLKGPWISSNGLGNFSARTSGTYEWNCWTRCATATLSSASLNLWTSRSSSSNRSANKHHITSANIIRRMLLTVKSSKEKVLWTEISHKPSRQCLSQFCRSRVSIRSRKAHSSNASSNKIYINESKATNQ